MYSKLSITLSNKNLKKKISNKMSLFVEKSRHQKSWEIMPKLAWEII